MPIDRYRNRDLRSQFADQYHRVLKHYGQNFGDLHDKKPSVLDRSVIATGIPSLDSCLSGGVHGITEIFGEESSGKTCLIGHIIAANQIPTYSVALVPTETLDSEYLVNLGVDLGNLTLIRGRYADDLIPILLDFLISPRRILVIDSINALRPRSASDQDWNEMAYNFLSAAQRNLDFDSAMIFTSQVRTKLSATPGQTFARGTESATRRFVDFCDVRLELQRAQVQVNTYNMVVKVVASNRSKPSVWVEVPAIKGKGVDLWLDAVRVARESGVFTLNGSRYYLGDKYLGNGERQVADLLSSEPELWSAIALSDPKTQTP